MEAALHGSTTATSNAAKSRTLRVTTVSPCTAADIETVWPVEAHMEWEKLVAPTRARHQREADELGAVLDAEKTAVQDDA